MGKLTLLFSKVLADDTLKLSDEQYEIIDEVCNSLPFKLTGNDKNANLTSEERDVLKKDKLNFLKRMILDKFNELNNENYQVLLSIYPDLSLKDIETIILSKPIEGYQNFSNLLELTNITAFKLTEDFLTFEPKYIQILYKVKYEDTFFNLLSIITLESRNNNIIRRSIST